MLGTRPDALGKIWASASNDVGISGPRDVIDVPSTQRSYEIPERTVEF